MRVFPCTGGRLSSAAENTAREDARPPANDTHINSGQHNKSQEGVRFRRWATRVLREMLLNRLDEVREIARLKRRVDIVEGDIKQIKGGVSYLVKQLSEPSDPPRRRIGFDITAEPPSKPYGKLHN